MLLKSGGDYGWPECYYDGIQKKLVLAPEYGGDGGKTVGVCANKTGPAAAFPAHWAPNAMTHYDQKQFPARYRDGVFIAFHGSWNRAPYAQGGYNVVFQPLDGDHASGNCEIFADGFAGKVKTPEGGRASAIGPRSRPGWSAVCCRRYSRTNLSHRLHRRSRWAGARDDSLSEQFRTARQGRAGICHAAGEQYG